MSLDLRTKPPLQYFPAVCSVIWLLFAIRVTLPSMFWQTDSPIRGTVVSSDGHPLAGVRVYGSESSTCCPFRRDQTTTDEEGQFRLEHPGSVIHFVQPNFQPKAFVIIKPGTSEVRVTMQPSAGSLSLALPDCGKLRPGQKRIGGGKYGLQFIVPSREVKVLRGKWDVDYVRHIIKPRTGEAYLGLWFGPYAMDIDPEDELFINSDSFTQMNVIAANGGVVGEDSRGHLRNGSGWRQTAVVGKGGARYQNVLRQDAELFDQVINSMCQVPYASPSR